MIETQENSKSIETIEKNNVEIKKETSAKTFRGLLNGYIKKVSNMKVGTHIEKAELRFIFDELLIRFNDFYPQKITRVEVEIISGWKGKGTYEFYDSFFTEDVIIRYPIKNKETLEVKWQSKTIPKENVNRMLIVLKKLDLNKTYSCYEIAEILGYDWKEIWKERTKIYFLIYYYPLKIFEAKGYIKYSGRGNVMRLK